jgi:hypothetical protein
LGANRRKRARIQLSTKETFSARVGLELGLGVELGARVLSNWCKQSGQRNNPGRGLRISLAEVRLRWKDDASGCPVFLPPKSRLPLREPERKNFKATQGKRAAEMAPPRITEQLSALQGGMCARPRAVVLGQIADDMRMIPCSARRKSPVYPCPPRRITTKDRS